MTTTTTTPQRPHISDTLITYEWYQQDSSIRPFRDNMYSGTCLAVVASIVILWHQGGDMYHHRTQSHHDDRYNTTTTSDMSIGSDRVNYITCAC